MSRHSGRVVHVSDNIDGAVYIGRAMPRRGLTASKWANPYKISESMSREEVLRRYSLDFEEGGAKRGMLAELPELRHKTLACWCRHDGDEEQVDKCHGDLLRTWLQCYSDEELRAFAEAGK